MSLHGTKQLLERLSSHEDAFLVGILDSRMNTLFDRILDKTIEKLALIHQEHPGITRTRFNIPRSGFHVRLDSQWYYPICMELQYEDF